MTFLLFLWLAQWHLYLLSWLLLFVVRRFRWLRHTSGSFTSALQHVCTTISCAIIQFPLSTYPLYLIFIISVVSIRCYCCAHCPGAEMYFDLTLCLFNYTSVANVRSELSATDVHPLSALHWFPGNGGISNCNSHTVTQGWLHESCTLFFLWGYTNHTKVWVVSVRIKWLSICPRVDISG